MEKKRHGAAGKMAVGLSALAVAALAAVVLNLLIWAMGKRFGKGRSVGK